MYRDEPVVGEGLVSGKTLETDLEKRPQTRAPLGSKSAPMTRWPAAWK